MGFALLHSGESAPPVVLLQTQVRVVLQAVCPLSEYAILPDPHPSEVELLQEPFTGTIQAHILIPAGKCALKAFHSVVVFVGAKYD